MNKTMPNDQTDKTMPYFTIVEKARNGSLRESDLLSIGIGADGREQDLAPEVYQAFLYRAIIALYAVATDDSETAKRHKPTIRMIEDLLRRQWLKPGTPRRTLLSAPFAHLLTTTCYRVDEIAGTLLELYDPMEISKVETVELTDEHSVEALKSMVTPPILSRDEQRDEKIAATGVALLARAGRFEDAGEVLDEITDPQLRQQALTMICSELAGHDLVDEARSRMEEITDPGERWEVKEWIADHYVRHGKRQEALALLDELYRTHGDDAKRSCGLARLYHGLDLTEKAKLVLREAAAQVPDQEASASMRFMELAKTAMEIGDVGQALDYAGRIGLGLVRAHTLGQFARTLRVRGGVENQARVKQMLEEVRPDDNEWDLAFAARERAILAALDGDREPLERFLATKSVVPLHNPVGVVFRLEDLAKDLSTAMLRRATDEALRSPFGEDRDKTLVSVTKHYVRLGMPEEARSTIRLVHDWQRRVEARNHLLDALLKTGTPQSVLQVLGDELGEAA